MSIALKEYLTLRQYFLLVLNTFDIPIEYRIKYTLHIEELDMKIRKNRERRAKERYKKIKSVGIEIHPFKEGSLDWS